MAGALAEHFSAQLAGEVAYYRSGIQVTDDAGGHAGVISLSKIDPIQRVPGVAVAVPSIAIAARPGTTSAVPLGLTDTITYTDPRERPYSGLRTPISEGRQLQANRQGEVVLGADLAGELRARVGDSVDLPVRPRSANPDFVSHKFKVVGVLGRTDTMPDATAAVGLLDAQTLLQESLPASFRDRVDPSSLASVITVYGKPGVDLDALADRISGTVPGVSAARPSDFVRSIDQGGRFTAIALAAAALGLAFGAVLMVNTMLVAVMERGRDIGLKRMLGARAWHVAAEHLLEAALLALAGGAIGVAFVMGLAALLDLAGRLVGMDVFLVTPRLVEAVLGAAAALGVASGLLPAVRAARLDPVLALRTR